jgi:Bbp16
MFVDALTLLSDGQQVTADAVSTNTIDFGNVTPKRKIGAGEPMGVQVSITAIGTNSGSAKLTVITSSAANLGTSPTIVGELDLATADIAAGKTYVIAISNGVDVQRYFGMNYDITGVVDFTVKAHMAPLAMLASRAPESYADAITVS